MTGESVCIPDGVQNLIRHPSLASHDGLARKHRQPDPARAVSIGKAAWQSNTRDFYIKLTDCAGVAGMNSYVFGSESGAAWFFISCDTVHCPAPLPLLSSGLSGASCSFRPRFHLE